MNDLRVFADVRFGRLRVMMRKGEPWFVATDVCKVLDISNPSQALRRLDRDEYTLISNEGIGKGKPVNAVNEPGLYALILRSRKPEAHAFRRWITHDVLPSIQKHGAYITNDTLDEIIDNPDFGIRLLSELKREREQRRALEAQALEQQRLLTGMRPKASYFDHVLQSKDLVSVTAIAKDYGLSARALNALLHRLGIQYKVDGRWTLYQQYAGHGYAHSYTEVMPGGKAVMYLRWTQKGRLFIYDQLKRYRGMLPQMEADHGQLDIQR